MLDQYYSNNKCIICNSKLVNTLENFVGCNKCHSYGLYYGMSSGKYSLYKVRIDKNDCAAVNVYLKRTIFFIYQGIGVPEKEITINSFMYVDHLNFDSQLERAIKLQPYD